MTKLILVTLIVCSCCVLVWSFRIQHRHSVLRISVPITKLQPVGWPSTASSPSSNSQNFNNNMLFAQSVASSSKSPVQKIGLHALLNKLKQLWRKASKHVLHFVAAAVLSISIVASPVLAKPAAVPKVGEVRAQKNGANRRTSTSKSRRKVASKQGSRVSSASKSTQSSLPSVTTQVRATEPKSDGKQLTIIGVALAVGTTLATLVFSAPSSKKSMKKSKKRKSLTVVIPEDGEDLYVPPVRQLRNQHAGDSKKPPTDDDATEEEEEIASPSTTERTSSTRQDKTVREVFVPPFATLMKADEVTEPPSTPPLMPPSAPSSPAPPAPPSKPGLLGRLFGSKTGASARPSDLSTALQLRQSSDAGERSLRTHLLRQLAQQLSPTALEDVQRGWSEEVGDALSEENDGEGQSVRAQTDAHTLARIFAEVVNAVVVGLIDSLVQQTEALDALTAQQKKQRKHKEVSEEEVEEMQKQELKLSRLFDSLHQVMESAGGIFNILIGGASDVRVEPIVYNGRAKKHQVEAVYSAALRQQMQQEMTQALKDFQQQQQGQTPDESATSNATSDNSIDAYMDTNAASNASSSPDSSLQQEQQQELERQRNADRLGRLQFLLGVKEVRRGALEQKVVMEMSLGGAGSGAGGLGGMLGGLLGGGGAGGAGALDDKALQEMFASLGDGGGNSAGMGAGMPGMPDLSKMKPEEIADMTKELLASLKQALQDGNVTKADVQEFEKTIGVDVRQFSNLLAQAKRDKRMQQQIAQSLGQQAGVDLSELEGVFRQLASIK